MPSQSISTATLEGRQALGISRARSTQRGRRWYGWYAALLGPILVLYLLFDRGFAHLHIPGTPLYVGECLLGVGIIATLVGTRYVRQALVQEPLLVLIAAFMLWGLARTLPNISHDGVLNCIRDAALWYYAAYAVLFVATVKVVPELPDRLVRGFSRVLPWVLLWLPFAILLPKLGVNPPHLPTSDVGALSHKGGNIAVANVICLAFLWLIPNERRSTRSRNLLSLVALLTFVLGATQNRGGAVAWVVAALVGLFLMRGGSRMIVTLGKGLAIALLLFGFAWTTNITVHTSKRTVSVDQLVTNAQSVTGGAQGKLEGTIAWRERIWTTVLSKEVHSGKLAFGFGMGPNLALLAGLPLKQATNPQLELRSPHDSHIDVLARMGIIGACMWLALWIGWFVRMFRARSRLIRARNQRHRGIVEVSIIAVIALLTNCIFDPTFESAQVAMMAWTIFGLGLVLARRSDAPKNPVEGSEAEVPPHGSEVATSA